MKIYADNRDRNLDYFIGKELYVKCHIPSRNSRIIFGWDWETRYVKIKDKLYTSNYEIYTPIPEYCLADHTQLKPIPDYIMDDMIEGITEYSQVDLIKPIDVVTTEEVIELMDEPWRSKYIEKWGIH